MINQFIKIILSLLFLLCLFKMPYGYYELVRFIDMLGFAVLVYNSYKENKHIEVFTYIALALLFQPFIKVALGRTIWNVMDVIVAVCLIVSLFIKTKKIAP